MTLLLTVVFRTNLADGRISEDIEAATIKYCPTNLNNREEKNVALCVGKAIEELRNRVRLRFGVIEGISISSHNIVKL